MQWNKISGNETNEIYELSSNGNRLAALTLHPFSNTARVETAEQKRVFLIRKEGFLRNKTVIRNEYGIKMGEFGSDQQGHFIQLNDDRLYHTIVSGDHNYLVISKGDPSDPIATCMLPDDSSLSQNPKAESHPGLLMVLCWYILRPLEKNVYKPTAALTV